MRLRRWDIFSYITSIVCYQIKNKYPFLYIIFVYLSKIQEIELRYTLEL